MIQWKQADTTDHFISLANTVSEILSQTALGNYYCLKLPKCGLQLKKTILLCH